jgi:DNA-dependent metalloprotease WSS1
MLHELSHIVHGPHDSKFHALWNQLRDEHEGLVMKGYTGEGFLSEGRRLGGSRQVPMHEARRLARAAAEKRKNLSAGSGQRLGGATPQPGQDIRNVIVSAIERRNETLKGCGNTSHNEREIQEISDSATRNGFRTQAEEDAANDAAIAQALWELVQEDEKAKYGTSYIPPTAANPTGNGGGAVFDQFQGVPNANTRPSSYDTSPRPVPVATKPEALAPAPEVDTVWACEICTLHNPASYLTCDACGTERSAKNSREVAMKMTDDSKSKRSRAVVDLTKSPTSKKRTSSLATSADALPVKATWQCSFCGNEMYREWWTCSNCGRMKDSSK